MAGEPEDQADAAALAGRIVGAERRAVHPPAEADFPNPAGGILSILYPWRGYILIASLVLIPVLVLLTALT